MSTKAADTESGNDPYNMSLYKLSLAVEQSPSVVVITDTNGTIEYVNTKFTQVTGYTAEEVIGQNPRILKSGERLSEEYAEMWDTILSGKEWRGDICNKRKNGEPYYVSVLISPIVNDQGEIANFIALQEDVTERRAMEESLRQSERRYSRAQKAAGMGSWEWNMLTNELFWSTNVESLFGFEEGQFGGKYEDFLKCVHPDDLDYIRQAVQDCINGVDDYDIEHRIVWPDGEVRWVSEVGDIQRDDSCTPVQMYGIIRDITERKQAQITLQEQQQRHLEEMNELKDQFVQTVSHDLKNPISAISIYLDLLQRQASTEGLQIDKYLSAIRRSINHMSELITDLLDLSRIETGDNLRLRKQSFKALLTRGVSEMMVLAEVKSITLGVDPDMPDVMVDMDAKYMHQVVTNVLSNAIKYTPDGGQVDIQVNLEDEGVVLVTKDNGEGIAKNELAQVFRKFYRAENALKSNVSGTGLGLAIVKMIVERHAGRVWIESELGAGTMLGIWLPASKR